MTESGFLHKVAIVTGAGSGIGRAVAKALAGDGACVAAVDQDTASLARLREDVATYSVGQLHGYTVDVRDSRAVTDMVTEVEDALGPVSVLVNVAGILRTGAVLDMEDEAWQETFAVNTHGVFHVSRAVGQLMQARGEGSIVTVASNAASVPRVQMAAYASSKAATVMFTKCLGLELAGSGVRCNVVSPGTTRTPMLEHIWRNEDDVEAVIEGSSSLYRVGVPLRRIAEPSEIAEAVLFLASSQSRHITMHDLRVDGGATLGA